MAGWEESLESVAIGLLSLEVNTIRKSGMSAQKMPDVPIALHSIVTCYADYLYRRGYGVNQALLKFAQDRIKSPQLPDPGALHNLMEWKPESPPMKIVDLTNGATSFEALRWAAAAALHLDIVKRGDNTGKPFSAEERAVVVRIQANCRQLTPLVLNLERVYPRPANPGRESPVLIDGTLEQTAQACFAGSVKFKTSLDVAVLIRKMWDIGDETVLAQTSVQLDGDVVTRISPLMEESQREFLLELHNSCLKVGLGQWQALFNLVTSLISSLGKTLFRSL